MRGDRTEDCRCEVFEDRLDDMGVVLSKGESERLAVREDSGRAEQCLEVNAGSWGHWKAEARV